MTREANLPMTARATPEVLLEKFFGHLADPDEDWNQAKQLVDLCQPIPGMIAMRCDYKSANVSEISVRPSGKFLASGFRYKYYSLLRIGIGDPRVWLRTVHAEGLEVISGCFVLAVIERSAANATVICVRQGRGCSIRPELWQAKEGATGWELTTRLYDPQLLAALCSTPGDDHEPEDDPLWHRYTHVWSTTSMERLHEMARLTVPPTPETSESDDLDIEVSSELEN